MLSGALAGAGDESRLEGRHIHGDDRRGGLEAWGVGTSEEQLHRTGPA
jgi:hypothetical protein